jgi:hypothetical protein
MIFVEPHRCWQDRMIEQRRRAEEEALRRRIGRLHPIQDNLMFIVREHGEPIRDVALAKAFAKIPGYQNRRERDDWMKKAWAHMTALIRMGRLQWASKRKHVEIAPPEKNAAYLAKMQDMLANLPKPRIWFGG